MDRLELLKQISFGQRVAEEEVSQLASYFVETDQWNRLLSGEVDIIKGDKGAGKSAIYSLLTTKITELFDKRILIVAAERPQGATVFKELERDPPTSEVEFINLWKLYILTLTVQTAIEYGINNRSISEVHSYLAAQGLIEKKLDLSRLLKEALRYVRSFMSPKSIEGSVTIDPNTGFPTFAGKITPSEPGSDKAADGFISIDRLAQITNDGLTDAGYNIWVLLDRLDVAFSENHQLEQNALRALFRVYRDFSALTNIKLKIFIRSDIWKQIVDGGFREASHITKDVVLEWSQASLLNLIVRRVLNNPVLLAEWNLDREAILKSSEAQKELFYKLFPAQVDQGPQKPPTLAWILSRCADGTQKTMPREVIHLLNTVREEEAKRIQHGEPHPPDGRLFDRSVLKAALPAVSKARLIQTILAEYPDTRPFLMKLGREKTEQSIGSLSVLWGLSEGEALIRAEELVAIGFFQKRGSRDAPTFWVPFLYRDALEMSQGKADED